MAGVAEFRAALMGYLEWGSRMVLHRLAPRSGRRRNAAGAPVGAGRRLALTVDAASAATVSRRLAATRAPSRSAPLAAGRQHVPEGVDPVADNAVHAEVEQPCHLVRVVNGPDVHLFAQPVCG